MFWTIPVSGDAVTISKNLKTATLHLEDVPVVDSFVFLGEHSIPATVSLDVTWSLSGPRHHYKPGSDDPTDPTNFNGKFREGVATGTFSGSNSDGFTFTSDPGATSQGVFAEGGTERNGVYVQ